MQTAIRKNRLAIETKHALGGDDDVSAEVKAALGELQKTTLGRIEKIETSIKSFGDIRADIDELAKKAGRTALADAGDGTKQLSPEEKKSLEVGVRHLFAGDQSAANLAFAQIKSMSWGVDSEGGYLVVPEFSTEMTRAMLDISPFASLARTIELKQGSTFEEPIDSHAAEAAWVGETSPAPRNETAAPDIGMFRAEVNELCAYPKMTQKLIDTAAIDPVAWLRGKVAEAFAAKESNAFHSGDGIIQPRGFLTYPTAATPDATRLWGTIEHVATGVSGGFAVATTSVNPADVLIATVGKLRQQYRAGAVWLMNRQVAAQVRTFKDVTGRYVWVDSLVVGQPDSLLGYPVQISEDMPDVSAGSLSIAFGNVRRAYTIVRRLGTRFLVDPYTQPPWVKLLAFMRVGGGMNNTQAIKLVKFATT